MFKDLVLRSRSYRSFDSTFPVPRQLLLDWIDCARLCPSSINLQVLKFRLVTSQKECDILLSGTRWAGKLKDITLPPVEHAPTAYIVICADRSVHAAAESFQKDVGICAQTVLLAATEAGFGGCMIGSFSPEGLQTDLKLPKDLVPQLVIALGKPDEEVALSPLPENGDTSYFREGGVHFVPKRALEDIVIE